MQTILITGINGLIGSALLQMLNDKEYCVYAIGRNSAGFKYTIELDLSQNWNDSKLPKKVDTIIHLAQSEKFRDFPASAIEVFNVNTLSTLKLLDYAKRVGAKKFIYASSGGVYGNSDFGFVEDSPFQPNKDLGFYLSTKFASELLLSNYTNYFCVNILRFFFVYGPNQKRNMLIPRLIESVKNGTSISLQGSEGIRLNPVYVDDAVKTILAVLQDPSSSNVNIAGPNIVSIKRISQIIGSKLNIEPKYEFSSADVKNLIGDITKMKQYHTPTTGIEQGIIKMLENTNYEK